MNAIVTIFVRVFVSWKMLSRKCQETKINVRRPQILDGCEGILKPYSEPPSRPVYGLEPLRILPHLVHRSIARWQAKRRLWLGLLLCEMCVVMWAVEGEAQSINYLWTHFLKRPVLTRLSFFDRQILVSKESRIARRTNHVKWKRTPKRRRKRSLFIVLNIKKLWPIWEDATGHNNKTAPGYCPAFSRRL